MSAPLQPIELIGLMDLQPSHYIAYAAFLQLGVALNFGLAYLDRRSGLLRLKRRLFSNYKAGNTPVVNRVSNILKRYRSGHDYKPAVERAHTMTKRYHTIVTSDWDDEHEISFFPALGVIFGFYGLTMLFLIGFFDIPGDSLYYQNLLLVLSQLTLLFAIVMIIRSWCKNSVTRIIGASFLYFFVCMAGWFCCSKGWFFGCVDNFPKHFHWYMLMAYLPIIYFVLRILTIHLHKTFLILPMAWWAAKFKLSLAECK